MHVVQFISLSDAYLTSFPTTLKYFEKMLRRFLLFAAQSFRWKPNGLCVKFNVWEFNEAKILCADDDPAFNDMFTKSTIFQTNTITIKMRALGCYQYLDF